ncbi:N-acetylmuramoyl-L-alanine amidase [Microcystis phage MinS1]|nr:N-acetylmuramoyl-L-alanine amidase [Microcystis phage MinS1]
MLTDLAAVARTSGLIVVEIDGWRTRGHNGPFDPDGVLVHHTGSYDEIGDTSSDLAYAQWLANVGRSDLPAPLCNLGLSAESVVYVIAAGRAYHAGTARASGPMPAGDGNTMYAGIEAYNSGSQGWSSRGRDAAGNEITQREGYARLCAALCRGYRWPADHVRAHAETSVTGKWDPGLLDMPPFRRDIADLITNPQEDDMADAATQKTLADILAAAQSADARTEQTLKEVRATRKAQGKKIQATRRLVEKLIATSRDAEIVAQGRAILAELDAPEDAEE